MVKLFIISGTQHTPQNKVSDTITHVTLNAIYKVVDLCHGLKFEQSHFETKPRGS